MLDAIRGGISRNLAGIDGGNTGGPVGGGGRDRDVEQQFGAYYNSQPVAKRSAPMPLIPVKTPVKQAPLQQQQQRQPQQSPLAKRTEPLSSFGYSEQSFIAEKLKKVAKDLVLLNSSEQKMLSNKKNTWEGIKIEKGLKREKRIKREGIIISWGSKICINLLRTQLWGDCDRKKWFG